MPPACRGEGVAHLRPDSLMHVHIFFEGFWADVKEEAGAAWVFGAGGVQEGGEGVGGGLIRHNGGVLLLVSGVSGLAITGCCSAEC